MRIQENNMCKRIFQLLFVLVISVVTISPAMAAQATNIVIEVVASKSMRFSWTPGSGDGSIVTMRLQATPESAPVDGIDYAADSDYSLAPQTAGSSGNFVVYKGSEKMVTVSGLVQNTTYTIAVYDYTGSGAGTNYLQLEPATINQATNDLAMHNYDNGIADCSTCHSNHGGDGLVPRGTGQEDVCKTCHNPLGAASNMSDIAMHGTPNHAAADVDDIELEKAEFEPETKIRAALIEAKKKKLMASYIAGIRTSIPIKINQELIN